MTIEPETLLVLAERYLDRQSWFVQTTAAETGPLELLSTEELSDGEPGLLRLLLAKGTRRVQLFVGQRRANALAGALRNEDAALLGAVQDEEGSVVLYDALADDECCRQLLRVATNGEAEPRRVRHVATLVSHASLVFDERLFMKCYRVLESGERPEAEVLFGLDQVGFNAIIAPIGRWRDGDSDIALVREFLPSALEGRLLALTSLRDLLAYVPESDEESVFQTTERDLDADHIAATAGGDIAGEIVRLGRTTANLHLAMAEAFIDGPLPLEKLAALAEGPETEDTGVLRQAHLAAQSASAGSDLGRAIRLHGDYHLRRVMRSDVGWLVTGFGDDPLYAASGSRPSLGVRTGSPLEDVADMFFAIGQIAREALALRPSAERELAAPLALAWIDRNRGAFLRGYLEIEGIERLLPADPVVLGAVLRAEELVRERRYEASSAFR